MACFSISNLGYVYFPIFFLFFNKKIIVPFGQIFAKILQKLQEFSCQLLKKSVK